MHRTDGRSRRCEFAGRRAAKECCTAYVGLDVPLDNIDIALAGAGRDGAVRHVGSVGGDLAALDKVLRRLVSQGLDSVLAGFRPAANAKRGASEGSTYWRRMPAQP